MESGSRKVDSEAPTQLMYNDPTRTQVSMITYSGAMAKKYRGALTLYIFLGGIVLQYVESPAPSPNSCLQ